MELPSEALHLNKIDYYVVSYGAVDVRAYAYRHPGHLRAAILDSPYNSQDAAFVPGYDADGAPHTLLVDERALLSALHNDYFAGPAFLNPGRALRGTLGGHSIAVVTPTR